MDDPKLALAVRSLAAQGETLGVLYVECLPQTRILSSQQTDLRLRTEVDTPQGRALRSVTDYDHVKSPEAEQGRQGTPDGI